MNMRKRRKRMGKLLGGILWTFGDFLSETGSLIRELGLKLYFPLRTVETKVPEIELQSDEEVKDLFPHSFATFKEGMASMDYCTRHDAAAKLIGWYLHHNGTPFIEDLVRAAEILLEDTSATNADISYLVGSWKDQASATTDKDREEAEEREMKIYEKVVIK
jgi:hypothetical protein